MNINDYIDSNGNFTHTKLVGSQEELKKLIQKYRETAHYKNKTDSQKILLENMLFPSILETGIIPNGLLLELVMPSVPETFRFSDMKVGAEIIFDLPPRFKMEDKE